MGWEKDGMEQASSGKSAHAKMHVRVDGGRRKECD